MSPRIAIRSATLALAACLGLVTAAAAMVGDSTMVAGPYTARVYPRIALGVGGRPYLLFAAPYAGQMTAWVATFDGTTRYEMAGADLAPDYRIPLLAVSPAGAPLASWFKTNGRFVVAERTTDGWVEDSSLVDVTRCSYCRQWVASDPVSAEPRVAFIVPDAAGYRVRYAARAGGAWAVTDVDPAPVQTSVLALAVDGAGRPWVAYGSGGYDSLIVAHRDDPDGPFVRETASSFVDDSLSTYYSAALALDPGSGQPRIAYYVWTDNDTVGYAWRDGNTGAWTSQYVERGSDYFGRPVSLALDAAGNPFVAWTQEVNILAGAPADDGTFPLAGGTTGQVVYAHRAGGTGTGPFTLEYPTLIVHDGAVDVGALAVTADGYPLLAVRSPDVGPPYSALLVFYGPALDVPVPAGAPLALAPPAPDPARAGEPVRVSFTLPAADEVWCEVLDVAGRRVAALEPRRCAAGPGALTWTPGSLRPGVYLVRLRSRSGLAATRRLAILR